MDNQVQYITPATEIELAVFQEICEKTEATGGRLSMLDHLMVLSMGLRTVFTWQHRVVWGVA